MLELSMAIWTNDKQVTWVMPHLRVKMVDLKVRLAVTLFESERTKLAFPIMQFPKQDANSGGYTLVALGRTRKQPRARSARGPLSNSQQLFLGDLARALSRQTRQRI
jgi:hypothetical protein